MSMRVIYWHWVFLAALALLFVGAFPLMTHAATNISTCAELYDAFNDSGDAEDYTLTADISCDETQLLGTYSGTFDGAGFTITLDVEVDDADNVGLFSALTNATVTDVTLDGSVIVTTATSHTRIGMLAGSAATSTITDVTVRGTLSVTGIATYVGSLIGLIQNTTITSGAGLVAVSATNSGSVGGLIGEMDTDATIIDSYATGTVSGATSTGGLVGRVFGTIQESYATGDVSSTLYKNVGGLVGEILRNATLQDVYSQGSVTATSFPTGSTGFGVGGLIGRQQGATIQRAYTISAVTITGDQTHTAAQTGAFVGKGTFIVVTPATSTPFLVFATVSDSFWNEDTSVINQSCGGGSCGGGFGTQEITQSSTEELNTQSTFTAEGWDFDDVWRMSTDTGYPELQWQPEAPTAPDAPTSLSVTSKTATTVQLSWTAPGSPNLTGYQVFVNGALFSTVSGTSASITGLSAGTSYAFSVKAVNSSSLTSTATAVSDTTVNPGGGSVGSGNTAGAPILSPFSTTPITTVQPVRTGSSGSYSPAQAADASPNINVDKDLEEADQTLCVSGSLIKLPDDGDLTTSYDSAVYYCGANGKRYVFPNAHLFLSWYEGFQDVRIVSANVLAAIPLGGNVTYRPGIRMIKLPSDPRVYAVVRGGLLRPLADEAVARALYGEAWASFVDDVSEAFFSNYQLGLPVSTEDL